jgi:hypothetical protein
MDARGAERGSSRIAGRYHWQLALCSDFYNRIGQRAEKKWALQSGARRHQKPLWQRFG